MKILFGRRILLSVAFILVMSIVLVGLTLFMGRMPTETTKFVIPPKGQYRIGEIFPLAIEVTGLEQPINAVQADLGFDPKHLEVVDISTKGSFATIFVQKEINNAQGYARINGGLPNPGYGGARGLFATVYLRGRAAGAVHVSYLPTSMILANDGQGSNILKDLAKIPYFILPEKISAAEHDKQTAVFNPDVLGTFSDKSQLIFFDEQRTDVLGSETHPESQPAREHESTILRKTGSFIEQMDRIILSLWKIW